MCTGSKFKSGLYFCADEKHKGVPLVDGWQLTSDSISIHLGALVAWSPPPEVHSLQLPRARDPETGPVLTFVRRFQAKHVLLLMCTSTSFELKALFLLLFSFTLHV